MALAEVGRRGNLTQPRVGRNHPKLPGRFAGFGLARSGGSGLLGAGGLYVGQIVRARFQNARFAQGRCHFGP